MKKTQKKPSADMLQRLGLLIKERRVELGMQQESLAQAVGLTRSSISNIESGRHDMTVKKLFTMCRVLDIEVADLLEPLNEKDTRLKQVEAALERIQKAWHERFDETI